MRRGRRPLVFIFLILILTMSAGCLFEENDSIQGMVKWDVDRPHIHIEHKYLINGTSVKVIYVDNVGFYWNRSYVMPPNLTTYLIINNKSMEECRYRQVMLFTTNPYYTVSCYAIYPGNITKLDIALVSKDVILARTTIWKRG